MKQYIELLTAILVLVGVVLGLLAGGNKAGVITVPVINQFPALQHNDSGGGGGSPPQPPPPSLPPPSPEKVAVPDVIGRPLAEAMATITGAHLQVGSTPTVATELCKYGSGMVESELPPAGTQITQNQTVDVYVCE